ncbi:MAG: hypothetical protein ACYC26_14090 [Phycisphaerales bacterium]
MSKPLGFKPDFPRTAARFEAWWERQIIDRPPVSLSVRPKEPVRLPEKQHVDQRHRWFDAEFQVERAIANMAGRRWLGDAIPFFNPNMGPDITAAPLGVPLEFSEFSSWSVPIIHDAGDWSKLFDITPNFDDVCWKQVEIMQDLAIERCGDRFLVGMTDLHGSYDILAALRDPQMLCMDVLDCPDIIGRAGLFVTDLYNQLFRRQWDKVRSTGFGAAWWMGCYHEGPAYVSSCDFWCMVSHEIARDMVLPCIEKELEVLERSIFHLDGPRALRHLDLLLDLPKLNAVQWVYGAGGGRASDWIEVYQRCQRAGKAMQVCAVDADDAMTVLEQLEPEGVWLSVGGEFENEAAAEAFLADVGRVAIR